MHAYDNMHVTTCILQRASRGMCTMCRIRATAFEQIRGQEAAADALSQWLPDGDANREASYGDLPPSYESDMPDVPAALPDSGSCTGESSEDLSEASRDSDEVQFGLRAHRRSSHVPQGAIDAPSRRAPIKTLRRGARPAEGAAGAGGGGGGDVASSASTDAVGAEGAGVLGDMHGGGPQARGRPGRHVSSSQGAVRRGSGGGGGASTGGELPALRPHRAAAGVSEEASDVGGAAAEAAGGEGGSKKKRRGQAERGPARRAGAGKAGQTEHASSSGTNGGRTRTVDAAAVQGGSVGGLHRGGRGAAVPGRHGLEVSRSGSAVSEGTCGSWDEASRQHLGEENSSDSGSGSGTLSQPGREQGSVGHGDGEESTLSCENLGAQSVTKRREKLDCREGGHKTQDEQQRRSRHRGASKSGTNHGQRKDAGGGGNDCEERVSRGGRVTAGRKQGSEQKEGT